MVTHSMMQNAKQEFQLDSSYHLEFELRSIVHRLHLHRKVSNLKCLNRQNYPEKESFEKTKFEL